MNNNTIDPNRIYRLQEAILLIPRRQADARQWLYDSGVVTRIAGRGVVLGQLLIVALMTAAEPAKLSGRSSRRSLKASEGVARG